MARVHITPKSEIQIGAHVFPTQKYRLIREALLAKGSCMEGDFLEAGVIDHELLRRVHSEEYLADFLNARNSHRTNRSELPLRPDIVEAYTRGAQASVEATMDAMHRSGIGINIGGGFHHAFADHAEGFCYLNDVAIAVRYAQDSGPIERALVIDLDVHQGNGTAHIFQDDPTVFTFSMHQENNYPQKQKSDLDLGLEDGMPDDRYLAVLGEVLDPLMDKYQPELVHYLAGADPYGDDKLGGLGLTLEGLRRRDIMVFEACHRRGVPVVVTLAGGYARNTADTVAIHVATVELALAYAGR